MGLYVPLVDACDTEWRCQPPLHYRGKYVPLVDACDTEWRIMLMSNLQPTVECHSLMPVILNGGIEDLGVAVQETQCHSLMPVILNGGGYRSCTASRLRWCHSLMPVILNGGKAFMIASVELQGATR